MADEVVPFIEGTFAFSPGLLDASRQLLIFELPADVTSSGLAHSCQLHDAFCHWKPPYRWSCKAERTRNSHLAAPR